MQILGLDIGCTDIKYGIINDGKIIYKNQLPTLIKDSLTKFTERLTQITSELIKKYKIDYVGVGCAGCIDINRGIIINPPLHEPKLQDFNFKSFFKDNFNLECFADNDVNVFTLNELLTVKCPNFLMLTIGTGIGSGIIINRELYRGADYSAGEFGRMKFSDNKTFEEKASITSLIAYAKELGLDVKSGLDVFAEYDKNNEKAISAVTTFYKNLAIGLDNLQIAFNPEVIVIGGGIAKRLSFIDELKLYLNNKNVIVSADQNDGGLKGTYRLVLEMVEKAHA